MASVDDRIVNMSFDNRKFGQNLSTTMGDLDKLKKSLDFTGQEKGLNNLQTAAGKFSMGDMGEAVSGVSAKFLALSTIAITALANITTKVIDTGTRIAKALTIQSALDGFHEYETNLNSIQTVLANTQSEGATLKDVNGALQDLNTYADQTIYNFSEMARNIGTFTAAGVKLDTSTKSIKGIANLAAISGSNSQQASTAMYQLSQAISSGAVKLQDWNSVVNAGMGGKVFQEALFETGKAMGTITNVPKTTTLDQWTASGKSFRESLQDGWITADVLTTTLEGFTGDLTDAQLKAKGYNKEQIKQIQKMGQMGKEAATKVKSLTQLIDTAKEAVGSGWTQTWQIVFGDFEEAKELFTGISNVIGDFVNDSANARNEMLQQWKDLGGRQDLIDGLGNAFKAVISWLKPIKEAFREFFPKKTGEDLARMTKGFKDFTERLKIGADTADKIKRSFRGVFAVFSIAKTVIKNVIGVVVEFFKSLDLGGGSILDTTANIGDFLVKMNDAVQKGEAFTKFFDSAKKIAQKLGNAVKRVKEFIGGLFDGFDESDGEGFTSVLDSIRDKFSGLSKIGDRFKAVWQKVKTFLQPLLDQLGDSFEMLWTTIKESFSTGNFDSVLDLFNTGFLAMLALAVKKFLSGGMDLDLGGGMLTKLGGAFEGLTGYLTAMQTSVKANTLLKIAGAVALLTGSIVILSMVDSDKLQSSLLAMSAAFTELLASMAILVKISGSAGFAKVPIMATSLMLLAGAMVILAAAVKIFSTMSWEELATGLAGVAGSLGAVAAGMSVMPKGMMAQSVSLIAIAGAINLLYLAVSNFSTLSWSEMGKGLAGVAGGLIAIGIGMKLMPKGMLLQSAALMGIAMALNALYFAIANLSGLSWLEIGKGLAGVAAGLGAIALGMKLMPKGMLLQATALTVLSGALLVVGQAIKSMSTMSWEELAKGLAGLAGSLGILAGGLKLMSGTLMGAAAISVASVGIMAMAKAIKMMGKLSWEDLAFGLGALAASLGVIGVAGTLVTAGIPGLIALGVAAAGIGIGLGAAGAGIGLFLTGLSALAAAGPTGIAVILQAFQGLIAFIPELALKMGEGLIAFLGTITSNLPVILEAFTGLLDTLLEAIIKETPKIVAAIGVLVQGLITILRDNVPDLIAVGLELLTALLQGIADNIGLITTQVIDIIANFLQAIADNLGKIIDAGVDIIVNLLNGIANRIGDVIAAGSNLVTSFISGLSKMVQDVIKAGTKFVTDLIEGIGKAASDIATAATDTALAFLKALGDNAVKFVDGGFQIIIDVINGIADSIEENTSELLKAGWNLASSLIKGIINGFADLASSIWNKLKEIVSNAWDSVLSFFGINSPSKKMHWVGEMMMTGWGNGIDRNGKQVVDATIATAEDVMHGMKNSMNSMQGMLNEAMDVDPKITPVLDLSKVEEGARNLNGMLNVTPITAARSFDQANTISTSELAAHASESSANVQNGSKSSGNVYEFKQYNTSPKALSPAEVYRQTRNLISLAESKMDKPA